MQIKTALDSRVDINSVLGDVDMYGCCAMLINSSYWT